MKILFDECLPDELTTPLVALGHECQTVRQVGFASKKNGELLALAENRWNVFLTSDRNMKFQQNMTGRTLAVVILRAKSNRIADLLPLISQCAEALKSVRPGTMIEVGPL